MPRPLDIIYFDPECSGYHPGHVKLLVDRAVRDPRIVTAHFVLAPEFRAYDSQGILETIQSNSKFSYEYCSRSVADACKPGSGLRMRQVGAIRWSEVRRLLRGHPGSILFDSLFDATILGAALDRRQVPGVATGIIHFCAPALLSNNVWKKLRLQAGYLLARRKEIPLVLSFDRLFVETGPRCIVDRWRWVPDPLPISQHQFDRLLSTRDAFTGDKVKFLLFGSLGRRKGLFTTLEAIERFDTSFARQVSVRILGMYSEGDAEELSRFRATVARVQKTGHVDLRFEERFASEDELIDALDECDVVLAPYLHHEGVSSVPIWAAAAGRPIVTQNSGWIGHEVASNKLGVLCNPANFDELSHAMVTAAKGVRNMVWQPEQLRRFAAGHSADHFYSSVISALSLCTG